jgi:hypothetical protein
MSTTKIETIRHAIATGARVTLLAVSESTPFRPTTLGAGVPLRLDGDAVVFSNGDTVDLATVETIELPPPATARRTGRGMRR